MSNYIERKNNYNKINHYGNMFKFAQKNSSDNFDNNIFNIYLEEDEIFLMPGESALVAVIEYTPDTFILQSTEFFGPYLKLEYKIVKDENCSTIEIYIHNRCLDYGNRIPDCASLTNFYNGVIDFVGDACIPVYHQKKGKIIAVGIRAKYDFDLEKLYTRLFKNCLIVEDYPEETLEMFED